MVPFEIVSNALMQPILDQVTDVPVTLPPELDRVRRGGVFVADGRLLLREFAAARLPAPDSMDDWSAERWVNDVAIDSALHAAIAGWRTQILGYGLTLAVSLLTAVDALHGSPRAQVSISLQSAQGRADPDIDFATGALHLYGLRAPADDARSGLEDFAQPVAILTARTSI